jgi:hypothetical protein
MLLLLLIINRKNNIENFISAHSSAHTATRHSTSTHSSSSTKSSSSSKPPTSETASSSSTPTSETTSSSSAPASTTTSSSSTSNKWTTNKDQLAAEQTGLSPTQKTEVENMINSISKSQLKTLIATQNPLLVGPQGPQGIQGPAGTQLIASGRLVNKYGSFDNNKSGDNNYFLPKYVATRTEGTSASSSLSFMDDVSPFASFQSWQLDVNNNLKNRYDNNCLTINDKNDKLYIDKCTDSPNQKWMWDNSNRLISTTNSSNTSLKCIGVTSPQTNVLTTNVPNCTGKECSSNSPREYLVLKDCDINNINEDEIWSFV